MNLTKARQLQHACKSVSKLCSYFLRHTRASLMATMAALPRRQPKTSCALVLEAILAETRCGAGPSSSRC